MAIDSIVGQLNVEALGKALTKSDDIAKPASGGLSFQDVLTNMDSGADFASQMGIGGQANVNPTANMVSMGGEGVGFSPELNDVLAQKPDSSRKLVDMLSEVNKGQNQMDMLVNEIMYSGKQFSNQELLVVQAHVFHFAQMTELTVKVAEHGLTSFKAMYNTQI